MTAPARAPSVPEVPTVGEAGLPGLLAQNWLGLSAPAHLPAPVTERLRAELTAAMQQPGIRDRLATVGIVPGEMSQVAFTRFVGEQIDSVGGMVKAMGIRND